jgi:HD-like signal output (HDOD) protein/DNA-binding response OmpR family regulator
MQCKAPTILIVDPCAMTRQCITVLLYAKKYTVHAVETIREAIDYIESNKPGVIIHEVEFPDGTGKDLIAQAEALHPETPTLSILLTQNEDAANHPGAPSLSLDQVLIKRTFSIKKLYAKVELLLDALRYESSVQETQDETPSSDTEPESAPEPVAESPEVSEIEAAEAHEPSKDSSADDPAPAAHAEPIDAEGAQEPEEAQEPESSRMRIDGNTKSSANTDEKDDARVPTTRTAQLRQTLCTRVDPLMEGEEVMRYVNKFADQQAMSPTAKDVIELCGNENATLEDIAESIQTDPTIAMKVIRIANSSAFSRGEPATSAADAVRRLGIMQICQCVMNIEIMDSFSKMDKGAINARRFWEHSIAVATACALIARDTRAMPTDLAYTLGLLHDVGRVVLSQALRDHYRTVIEYANEKELALDSVERQMLGVDHAQVVEPVLKHWNMTSELIDPIMRHHKSLDEVKQELPAWHKRVAALALADRLVHALNIGCSGNPLIYPTEAQFEALGINADWIEKIMDELPDAVADMKSILLIGIGGNKRERPQKIQATIRPNYISSSAEKDAIRIWVDSHAAKTTVDLRSGPNIHIVRLRTQQDAIDAAEVIREVEEANDHECMPVLVLTDRDDLVMPEAVTDTRSTRMITVPFRFGEFKQAIESFPELTGEDQPARKSA